MVVPERRGPHRGQGKAEIWRRLLKREAQRQSLPPLRPDRPAAVHVCFTHVTHLSLDGYEPDLTILSDRGLSKPPPLKRGFQKSQYL